VATQPRDSNCCHRERAAGHGTWSGIMVALNGRTGCGSHIDNSGDPRARCRSSSVRLERVVKLRVLRNASGFPASPWRRPCDRRHEDANRPGVSTCRSDNLWANKLSRRHCSANADSSRPAGQGKRISPPSDCPPMPTMSGTKADANWERTQVVEGDAVRQRPPPLAFLSISISAQRSV